MANRVTGSGQLPVEWRHLGDPLIRPRVSAESSAAADLAGQPLARGEAASRRRPLPGLVGLWLRPCRRAGGFVGRWRRRLGRGLGPRFSVFRRVLVETAVFVLAAGAAMAGLVSPRSWTSLGSDCQSLPQGFRFRLPSIARPSVASPHRPIRRRHECRAVAVHALTFYICTCRVSWYGRRR